MVHQRNTRLFSKFTADHRHQAYGFTFTPEFQWMAAKGYVVLYTAIRAAVHRTVRTSEISFITIIRATTTRISWSQSMGSLNEDISTLSRLGVTGGSGSGIHSQQGCRSHNGFRGGISRRSIADWAGFWYTADFTLFNPTWFRAAPWEDPDDFVKRSPITYVKNITTPMMFIEGEADWRTPPNEAE
ncbi:MAG: prolyl oligopeptidase family serine peptidase [Acidobacteria bacterium]|nr:prolyl oligopeptidase family serine peptidase [Acidobacteriota bacterium]